MMRRPSARARARLARVVDRLPVKDAERPLAVSALVTVCTGELKHELEPWLASAALHHPGARLYVVGDYPACDYAHELAVKWRIMHRFRTLPLLAGDGLANARARCRGVAKIHRYWREDVIWWKLEGLRRVLADFETHADGVLLTDCDITFAGPVAEIFPHADVVLSPFYWAQFDHRVKHPRAGVMPLPQRDGYFNAGYLLTRRVEVAETWLELYESGIGGFYEQKCLEEFPRRFRCDYFSPSHNWGKWRRETPRPDVVSLHYHHREQAPEGAPRWLRATRQRVDEAARHAISVIGDR